MKLSSHSSSCSKGIRIFPGVTTKNTFTFWWGQKTRPWTDVLLLNKSCLSVRAELLLRAVSEWYYISPCEQEMKSKSLCKTSTWHASVPNQVSISHCTLGSCCAEVPPGWRTTCEPPRWAARRLHTNSDTKWPKILMLPVLILQNKFNLWRKWMFSLNPRFVQHHTETPMEPLRNLSIDL